MLAIAKLMNVFPDMPGTVRRAVVTFVVGAIVMALLAAVALSSSPPRVVRISAPGVKALSPHGGVAIGFDSKAARICQSGEVLPAGVSAERVSVWAFFGAPVHLSMYKGSRLLTQGSRAADWTSSSVTVPVRPLRHAVSGVKACIAMSPNEEPLTFLGAEVPASQDAILSDPGGGRAARVGRPLHGRLVIEYLASSNRSWWSRLLEVARRLGLGRAYSGTWIALLLALMVAAIAALALRAALEDLR